MNKIVIQEALVSNFAALLGCKAAGSGSTSSGITTVNGVSSSACAEDFLECLSDAVLSSDVVATLPSLEMKAEASSGKEALPQVGETHQKLGAKPEMKASVLDNAAEASAAASKLEQVAAQSLGNLTSWTKSTLVFAPQAASKSISTSFSSLVDSRVRAWTLLLLRHSLTTGDSTSRNRLLSMLSSTIEIRSSETSFKTLPLPESARLQPKEADVILPLLFEAVLQISVQGKNDTVPLRAPGTIAAHFAKNENASKPGLTKVEVRLDTGALLESMVEQARLVVFKAVARATSVNVDSKKTQGETAAKTDDTPQRSLSSFSSALSLSADQASQNPRLQKARSSALRLNSILQGKTQESASMTLSKIRKTRSVQWEQPLDTPTRSAAQEGPSAKRQRLVQSQARLRSMKSFGRPHAQSGREVKNATFGDFGRSGATWGRDGKLLNHPVPGGGLTNNPLSSLNAGAPSSGGNQNATFDFGKPPQRRTISSRLSASLSFSRPQPKSGGIRGLPSTLPRTATALESWLVNTATKGKG